MKKPFIVAEMSASHNGSLERALAIVDAAADAGADALKLQTWSVDRMCLDQTYALTNGPWVGRKLFDLYRDAWLPWDWHKAIFDRCIDRGIECFSTPFDRASVDFLEELGCPKYKIASFELVDLDLIRYAANTGKPIILSTGMATEAEISRAYFAAGEHTEDITVLKCTSAYPSDASDANLATMSQMLRSGVRAGLSDHTPGIGVAVAASVLGAFMIEKHLTLSRSDGGPDAGFSMEPHEFKQMVTECRRAVASIGEIKYGCGPSESTDLRRSLYVCKDIKAGEVITREHIATARPALGAAPNQIHLALGHLAIEDMPSGSPLLLSKTRPA